MRNWLKTLLFMSAFSPVLISVAVARVFESGIEISEIYYVIAGVSGVFVGMAIIGSLQRLGESLNFAAKKIEATDSAMLAVVGTYFVPFITRAKDLTWPIVLAFAVLLIAILWVTSALIPHPLLRFFAYRFYKVESNDGVVYTLITTRDLNRPSDIKLVKKITNSMLVEVKIAEPFCAAK